jgi:hypothetical protein
LNLEALGLDAEHGAPIRQTSQGLPLNINKKRDVRHDNYDYNPLVS